MLATKTALLTTTEQINWETWTNQEHWATGFQMKLSNVLSLTSTAFQHILCFGYQKHKWHKILPNVFLIYPSSVCVVIIEPEENINNRNCHVSIIFCLSFSTGEYTFFVLFSFLKLSPAFTRLLLYKYKITKHNSLSYKSQRKITCFDFEIEGVDKEWRALKLWSKKCVLWN